MVITIDLPPEVEAQLRESASRGDSETVRRLLADALIPTVEALLRQPPQELTDEEFERLADELADMVDAALGPDHQPLSDYAVSREGLYQDHP